MDAAWLQPLGFGVFVAACLVLGFLGADSRPGFANGRSDVKDRWFVHSRDEYRR